VFFFYNKKIKPKMHNITPKVIVLVAMVYLVAGILLIVQGWPFWPTFGKAEIPFIMNAGPFGILAGVYFLLYLGYPMVRHREEIADDLGKGDKWLWLTLLPLTFFFLESGREAYLRVGFDGPGLVLFSAVLLGAYIPLCDDFLRHHRAEGLVGALRDFFQPIRELFTDAAVLLGKWLPK
jgi:hypothetical protein